MKEYQNWKLTTKVDLEIGQSATAQATFEELLEDPIDVLAKEPLTSIFQPTKTSIHSQKNNLYTYLEPQSFEQKQSQASHYLNKSKTIIKPTKTKANQSFSKKGKKSPSQKRSLVPLAEIKRKFTKGSLVFFSSFSIVLVSYSLVVGFKGVRQFLFSSTEEALHPIDIPYIDSWEQCKTNGNVWTGEQCLDYGQNNPL